MSLRVRLLASFALVLLIPLVTLGLLAELQVRTYHESADKSIYVIREVLQSPSAELLVSSR